VDSHLDWQQVFNDSIHPFADKIVKRLHMWLDKIMISLGYMLPSNLASVKAVGVMLPVHVDYQDGRRRKCGPGANQDGIMPSVT
jgi:hypothetical protein